MSAPSPETASPSSALPVPIVRLPHAAGQPLPAYASTGAAGLDLLAAVAQAVSLPPGGRQIIPTGIALALPFGFEGQVRSRSGLAARHGVVVLNSPGTIDSDYRGEVGVLLANFGEAPFQITPGLRIAQLVIAPVSRIQWREVDSLTESHRGAGGFGSTGLA